MTILNSEIPKQGEEGASNAPRYQPEPQSPRMQAFQKKLKIILFLTFNLMIFPILIITVTSFYLSPGSLSLFIILSCSLYKTPSNSGSGLENPNPLFVVCKWAFVSSEFIWYWLLVCKYHWFLPPNAVIVGSVGRNLLYCARYVLQQKFVTFTSE